MKKIFNILFILTLLLILPLKVNADCVSSELARFTNEAAKAKVTYDYLGNNNFSITVSDITLNFYVQQYPASEFTPSFVYSPAGYETIDGFRGGTTIKLNFYAAKSTACSSKVLRTVDIELPKANQYYGQPICEGAEEYFLCKKFTDTSDMSTIEVYNKIEEYKKQNPTKEADEEPTDEEVEPLLDRLITFFFDNLNAIMFTIAGLSIIGIVIILLVQRKKAIV